MFGSKKEVYTMPPDKPKRGRVKPTQPVGGTGAAEDVEPFVPEYPINEESRVDADAAFLADEPSESAEPTPTKAKKKRKEKPPKVEKNPGDKVPFFRDKRKVGILLVTVSLLVSLVVSPLLNYFTMAKVSTAVVAVADIPQGTQITGDMISAVNVPEASLLTIHLRDKAVAVNQYASTDIVKDELLTAPKLSSTIPYSNSYLYLLPAGKKAISVTVPSLASGLSGKLQSGDIISLYVMLEKTDELENYTAQLLPELTYVQVLSSTNSDGYDVSGAVDESNLENPIPATMTLAVNDAQAAILAGIESEGTLHAALVVRGDETVTGPLLSIQEEYFRQLEEAENENAEGVSEADAPPMSDEPQETVNQPEAAPPPSPAQPVRPPVVTPPKSDIPAPQPAPQEEPGEVQDGGDGE